MRVTKESFLQDISKHKMTILQDDDVFRCIEFRNPDEKCIHYFYVTTFPGSLVISGDCGAYVFSRKNDMFEFFRTSEIYPSYWANKVDAKDRIDGIYEFDIKRLKDEITTDFNEYRETYPVTYEDEEEFRDEILDKIEDEHTFFSLFEIELECGFHFATYDYDPYVFCNRFIWNCYAIVWAIEQYDKVKGSGIHDSTQYWYVGCDHCDYTRYIFGTKEEVIKEWNHRPAEGEGALRAENEMLKEKLENVKKHLVIHRDHAIQSYRQDGKAYRIMNDFLARFCNNLLKVINTNVEKKGERMSNSEVYLTRDEIEHPYAKLAVMLEDKRRKAEQMSKTVFERLTTSPEVLAANSIYFRVSRDGEHYTYSSPWIDTVHETRAEAIAETVAKLKEVAE